MKIVPILMTASVSTRGMKGACFTDKEREGMYVNALSYYIVNIQRKAEVKIVFAENSGWNLDNLKIKLPDYNSALIEFISVAPDLFDISRGKGYNELLLITEAVQRSRFIKESGAFFKVTGRYPIYNLMYFLNCASKQIYRNDVLFYADIKDHCLYDWLHLGWCEHSFECRLWGVKNDYYQRRIAPLYMRSNDYTGTLLENVLFDYIKKEEGKVSLRFKREPHFGGMEGSDIDAASFSKEQDSLKGKIKRFVGNVVRIFLPFFYF